ncbi:MAG TPA: choice-of-anchor tandem repeat GloVer-containing protein [Cyclobacteriaceae bacterium]
MDFNVNVVRFPGDQQGKDKMILIFSIKGVIWDLSINLNFSIIGMKGSHRLLILFIQIGTSAIAQPTLVGSTIGGGTNSNGVIFTSYGSIFTVLPGENTISKSYWFDGGAAGDSPEASLLPASNGKFYGTTVQGGATDEGTLYELDLAANKATKLVDFSDSETGRAPYGTLIEASNGKFYGITWAGGSADKGVLFEYDPVSKTLTKKVDFIGDNGDNPWSALIIYKEKIYGMTLMGGTDNKGVLFEFDPVDGSYAKKINFGDLSYSASTWTRLTVSNDNKIYGTSFGVTNSIIFEYDPVHNLLIKKAEFADLNIGSTRPVGSLIQVPNGKIYGVSDLGGTSNTGFLFEFDPATNSLVNKYNFESSGLNGNTPRSFVLSKTGKLYGTTRRGGKGSNGSGVLFEFDYSSNTYSKKIDFGLNNGYIPNNLIELCFPPTKAGTIETSKIVCEGITDLPVSISSIPGSDSYLWELPEGTTIKSGDHKNSLLVDLSHVAVGNYIVKSAGKNVCGTGPSSETILTVQERPAKPTITFDNSNFELPVLTASEGSTYQWHKNGVAIKEATAKIYTPDSEGEYSVVVTNSNECLSTPSSPVAISITGLYESNENLNALLYPNPTEEWIVIENEQGDVTQPSVITISDLSGRKLVTEKIDGQSLKLNVKHLNPGLYIIQLNQKEITKTWRFIKKN